MRDLETARTEHEQVLQARSEADETVTKERQRAEALVRDLETARTEHDQVLQARRQAEEDLNRLLEPIESTAVHSEGGSGHEGGII